MIECKKSIHVIYLYAYVHISAARTQISWNLSEETAKIDAELPELLVPDDRVHQILKHVQFSFTFCCKDLNYKCGF